MRLQFSPSASENTAVSSKTASRSGSSFCRALIVPSRNVGLIALALTLALGLANRTCGQTVATDLFSGVLAISVMPSKSASELSRWDSAIRSDAGTSTSPAAIAIENQGDEAFAQLLGRRTQLAGRTLIPVGSDAAFYSARSSAGAEIIYDANSALFATPSAGEVEFGYNQGLDSNAKDSAAADSESNTGNVIASLAALRRDSRNAAIASEASYANLTWSPAVTSGKSTTGLVSFVYAATQESSVAYAGPTVWTSRTSTGTTESFGTNFAEPATPDFETYLTIGAALAFLGLVVRRSQPEQVS